MYMSVHLFYVVYLIDEKNLRKGVNPNENEN